MHLDIGSTKEALPLTRQIKGEDWVDAKRIRKFAAAVLVVLVAVNVTSTVWGQSPTIAASSASNGRIAFVSDRDGNNEIYVMSPDGSGVIRLTGSPDANGSPSWSSDGAKIAFTSRWGSSEEIYVMNADGSGQKNLTDDTTDDPVQDMWPSWSPDSMKIAFTSDRDFGSQIYVMNSDGSGLTGPLAAGWAPSWSPDGGKIVFVCYRDNDEICVMNPDGSGVIRLTVDSDDDTNPGWSPDGRRIVFQSDRDQFFNEIYTMNADGTEVARLTYNQVEDRFPSWSPDGGKIVFESWRDNKPEIYVMNADGSGVTRLTSNSAYDTQPAWGPGGSNPTPTPTMQPTSTSTVEPTMRDWTLMFYMAGDNDSGVEWAISVELEALKEASYNRSVNIVVLRDGVDSEATYEILSDGEQVVVASLGEVSMGDPGALGGFVKWARERYPAQHYALVIDDHGQGLAGVALDNHPTQGDWLGPKEMRQALEQAGKVDVIYMNACQMGNLESAYQLRGYADYYVAYEGIGWGPGDFRSIVETVSSSTEAEQLALSMAETYFSRYPNSPSTVSVVRMSEVENVAAKTSALAGVLRSRLLDIGGKLWDLTDVSLLQRFDENSPANGIGNEDALADLYHFAWLVKSNFPEQEIKTATQELMDALGSYVVENWSRSGTVTGEGGRSYEWSHEDSHGVSIACPRKVICFYTYNWLDFAGATHWPCQQVSVLSETDSIEAIEWGPFIVDLVTTLDPDAPMIADPPVPIPLLQEPTEAYLPMVFSQR